MSGNCADGDRVTLLPSDAAVESGHMLAGPTHLGRVGGDHVSRLYDGGLEVLVGFPVCRRTGWRMRP